MSQDARIMPCVSVCEIADGSLNAAEIEDLLASACWEAGFPGCERLYVGSYFCENYFGCLTDVFHEAVREVCARHEMGATLVIPILGQAFLDQTYRRIDELLDRFADVYDEVVVNDVACFMDLSRRTSKRIGLGRLFSKGLRDARYPEVFDAVSLPELSAETVACLRACGEAKRALVEVDPTSVVVDVSRIHEAARGVLSSPPEGAIGPDYAPGEIEIAVHLPYCYATTGRNCSLASIEAPDSEKFRLGRGCRQQCLRVVQGSRVARGGLVDEGSRVDEGVRYVKHGRTHYFANPECKIAGADAWRIIYAAPHETMR